MRRSDAMGRGCEDGKGGAPLDGEARSRPASTARHTHLLTIKLNVLSNLSQVVAHIRASNRGVAVAKLAGGRRNRLSPPSATDSSDGNRCQVPPGTRFA